MSLLSFVTPCAHMFSFTLFMCPFQAGLIVYNPGGVYTLLINISLLTSVNIFPASSASAKRRPPDDLAKFASQCRENSLLYLFETPKTRVIGARPEKETDLLSLKAN